MGEFDLIKRFFTGFDDDQDVVIGVGDDAALINVPADQQLVTSVDTLIEGVHFFSCTSAKSIAQRALASNLSDMAAMGATPRWCLLSLSLPTAQQRTSQHDGRQLHCDDAWLAEFSEHTKQLLDQYQLYLVGGDTTAGAQLTISYTLMGLVPLAQTKAGAATAALTRRGAKPNDDLYVTGFLGEAAAGLSAYTRQPDELAAIQQRFLFPQARVDLGVELRELAHSCIDISDGLLADAGHLARQSQCDIEIYAPRLLCSKDLKKFTSNRQEQLEYMCCGGDDYELLFSASAASQPALAVLAEKQGLPITRIGKIKAARDTSGPSVRCLDQYQQVINFKKQGFEHFVGN